MKKMRHCCWCGEDIGESDYSDPFDTCGNRECDRESRNMQQQERDNAHDQLDRDCGWK